MLKSLISVAIFSLVGTGMALAACPPAAVGTTAEAIRANEQRVICLQQDLQTDSRIRQLELDNRANSNAINRLQLERRFDALPRPIPSPFNQPAPFAPN